MGSEIQKAPEITLVKSEIEGAAARVAERAMNTTLDGVTGLVADVFGGLIGDNIKQWRNRNLVEGLVKTKKHLEKLGIPIENAKSLPMGELYQIFDGMSKQSDPQLSDMWSALLANAMNGKTSFVIDPSLPKILDQLSGVDASILKFYHDAFEERNRLYGANGRSRTTSNHKQYSDYLQKHGSSIIELFGSEIISSSISNLQRTGLLFVEGSLGHDELVTAEMISDTEISVDTDYLKSELGNIYYHLRLAHDDVEDHEVISEVGFMGGEKTYYLPYDLTRLAKRLMKACS